MLGFYTVGIFVCLGLLVGLVARKLYTNALWTFIFLLGSLLCQFSGI